MEIAVLGGGNGAYAAAADLAEQGHKVRFWRRDMSSAGPLPATRTITLRDHRGAREVRLTLVSDDLRAVLDGAKLILVPVPAFAQLDLARRMAPHLRGDQVVFLPPGSFGSYAMARAAREAGGREVAAWAEAGTLPYLARKRGPAEIAITTRATRLPTGVFPALHAAHALAVIRAVFPAVEPAGDALSGALMNAGPIIHPPLILMNAGPIEHFEHWDIHNEGTQPSIRRVTTALDQERIATREALGYPAPHFPLADHYSRDGDEWMYGNLAHEKLVDSGHWREHLELMQHRYMREDVVYGLAFLASVAAWAGVPSPVASGLLALAGAALGQRLEDGERTLAGLGLASLSPEGLQLVLQEGLR